MSLLSKLNLIAFKIKWRTQNKHNRTVAKSLFPIQQVSVGNYTYGGIYVLSFDDISTLKIGNYCSVAPEVAFMLSADHYLNHISTFPYKVMILGEKQEGFSKGNIIVDDDVWIGYGAIILSGVHIGQGAVIAAGSVVTKDVPPYAIIAGVPGKIIKYRFNEEIRKELIKIDYLQIDSKLVSKYVDRLYEEVINKAQLAWLPKKI